MANNQSRLGDSSERRVSGLVDSELREVVFNSRAFVRSGDG